jgi:hypothetical protein
MINPVAKNAMLGKFQRKKVKQVVPRAKIA